jgi:hypothetical protein
MAASAWLLFDQSRRQPRLSLPLQLVREADLWLYLSHAFA